MKYLKGASLNKFSPSDTDLFVNAAGRAVMNIPGGLRLPKGTEAERPTLSGIRQAGGANGTIRYNTDTDSIEAYVGGAWEIVRAPGATAIQKQTLGPGDAVETVFGPLDFEPAAAENVIVLIENVFQVSDTNYTLIYDYLGTPGDTRIQFTSPVPFGKNVTLLFGFAN